ncbi:MAG: tRNA lysidine(34) synthetase TilS, partial [Terriglobales bacterium]
DANRLLRAFLMEHGLRTPTEAKLTEMLRQLTQAKRDRRVRIAHDGAELRVYRDGVVVKRPESIASFTPIRWSGERRLALPQLGGALHFRKTRGAGIDRAKIECGEVTVRLRSGGERLQPDARRPRRTLKNLFQEAGIPPWERERVPMLFCGCDLIWVPGLGVDARYQAGSGARGIEPDWKA